MKFYQASFLRCDSGKWLLVSVHENSNPLRTRVDDFAKQSGCKVMRMSVAPEDAMRCWEFVDPRELHARYVEHARKERQRIRRIINRCTLPVCRCPQGEAAGCAWSTAHTPAWRGRLKLREQRA